MVYIPANPPSPVPEESEEGSSPRSTTIESGTHSSALFDAVSILHLGVVLDICLAFPIIFNKFLRILDS